MDIETIFQGGFTPAKWRLLGDYLKGQRFQPSVGNGLKAENSGTTGFSISAIKQREIRQSQAPPFSILSLRKVPDSDPVEYEVNLQEGFVIDRPTAGATDSVVEIECNIDGDPMSTRPRPDLTISDGDYIACQFDTTTDGLVTGTPEIVTAQAEVDSVHHQPASGAGTGSTGSCWVKLAQFNIVDGAPEFTIFQQSDIENYRLWKGRNVGGARYIHKQRSGLDDSYDFRTLEQHLPTGRDFGKVIVDFENGDEFDDANDAIKFSAIAERASNPQVNVNDDGAGVITVEGNDRDGSLTWTDCDETSPTVTTLLQWEDGLITSSGVRNFKAGCGDELPSGSSGDILYHDGTDWVVLNNPGASALEYWVLTHDGTSPSWTDSDGV